MLEVFVPGRLCLFGEHSDWSGLPDGTLAGPERIPADAAALDAAARRRGFFSHAAGVAAEVASRHRVGGLRLVLRGDLPMGKGLSSSAALCVLAARAFSRAYALGLGPRKEMGLAYAGERRVPLTLEPVGAG